MKYKAFIQTYTGHKVDYDGVFGAQCVDLFRQFCHDVLQIPHTGSCSTSGGAKDLFLDYDKMPLEKKYFTRIKESRSAKYRAGDVLVFNATDKNEFGHVALLVSVFDDDSFICFEQNGIKQDGAKLVLRDRTNMLGALRSVKEVA